MTQQLNFQPHFDGATYEPSRDHERLTGQKQRIFDLMKDGQWRTLEQISEATDTPQASVSARLRDFRKPKFGGHQVDRYYVEKGLFMYRVIENKRAEEE